MSKLYLKNKNLFDSLRERVTNRKKRNWEYNLKKFVFGYYDEVELSRHFWDLYFYPFLKKQKILYNFDFSFKFSHDHGTVCVTHDKTPKTENNLKSFSFGIPTKSSSEQLDKCIEHIFKAANNLNQIEILIATENYDGKFRDKVKLLPMDDKLTVKKNALLREAQYDNICILHERILLPSTFFLDIINVNPNYEVIGYQIQYDGVRIGDWLMSNVRFWGISYLDYKSYSPRAYLDGSFIQINKNIKNHVLWDENMEWNQGEDIRLFLDLYNEGIVPEIYTNCILNSSSWDWKKNLFSYYNSNYLFGINLLKTLTNYIILKSKIINN